MAILLQFRAIDARDLTKGSRPAPQNRNFATVSRDRHARSYERVAPSTAKSQFYYSFVRSTRTILRKGCAQHRKIAILLQFRAIDTRDLTKGVHRAKPKSQFYDSFVRPTRTILRKGCTQQNQNRNFTTVSCDRHARSYERVAPSKTKIAILLQFRAIDTHDLTRGLHFRKHFPDHGAPPPPNALLNVLMLSKC